MRRNGFVYSADCWRTSGAEEERLREGAARQRRLIQFESKERGALPEDKDYLLVNFTSGPRPCGKYHEPKSCLSPPHRPSMTRDGKLSSRAMLPAMVNSMSQSRPQASIVGHPAQRGGRNAPMSAFTRRRPRLRQQASVRASAASLTSLTLSSSTRRKWLKPAA